MCNHKKCYHLHVLSLIINKIFKKILFNLLDHKLQKKNLFVNCHFLNAIQNYVDNDSFVYCNLIMPG